MEHYLLPYGLEKKDMLYGTVIAAKKEGIKIRLELNADDEYLVPDEVFGFAYAHGRPGQRVLVSLIMFNKRFNNFKVNIDSYLIANEENYVAFACPNVNKSQAA